MKAKKPCPHCGMDIKTRGSKFLVIKDGKIITETTSLTQAKRFLEYYDVDKQTDNKWWLIELFNIFIPWHPWKG